MDKEEDLKKRNEIFELVAQYVNSKPIEKFIPGKTWIRYAGRVFDVEEMSKYKEAGYLQLDTSKAKRLLNWSTYFDFEVTLRNTVIWYKNYYNNLDIIKLTENQINNFMLRGKMKR